MRIAVLLLSAVVLTGGAASAEAATITVTTNADISASQCTVRNAIEAANTNTVKGGCAAGAAAGTDVIDFTLAAGSTITVAGPLPEISSGVDLQGPGADRVTISGGESSAIFRVGETATAAISDLTIADALCGFACGIRNEGSLELTRVVMRNNVAKAQEGTNAFPEAGAIYNTGTLTLTESELLGNKAVARKASAQNSPQGGAIYNQVGSVTIDRSTLQGNAAIADAEGGSSTNAGGGAISNSATLTIRRSTFIENLAGASGGASANSAQGGAISDANAPSIQLSIDRSTFYANAAVAAGTGPNAVAGGFNTVSAGAASSAVSSSTIVGNSAPIGANVVATAEATFKNTIIAQPGGGSNCGGTPLSLGFNLEDANSCNFSLPGDQPDTNPLLSPAGPASNGGPTMTIAVLAGSPAIDQGLSSAAETVDQRGMTRPVLIPGVTTAPGGDGTDIGAFEVQSAPRVTITAGPTEGSSSSDRTQRFEFESDRAPASFRCSLDGAAFEACAGPQTIEALADGHHTFAVEATDVSGYTGDPTNRGFTIDTSAVGRPTAPVTVAPAPTPKPKVTILGLKAKTFLRRLTIRFASTEAGSSFRCKLDAGPFKSCRSPFKTKKLTFGRHRFSVIATTAAGQVGVATTKTFRVARRPR